ncbi:alpha/beta hydrolase [Duganella sp. LX20W]|uniref:Alpha/beta hydrolase n=1 Tax=Rugamonas brunnea TaxID=2758569 RepID=A0A7W2EW01_9BURK|nr:alpha/beta hydrolase [Rugamonas brunnea]MBA5639616.1 alpha/beta hydrolase [Rugamonas brunnea]
MSPAMDAGHRFDGYSWDVDYLHVDGRTLQATIYQPEGAGPFPVIVDVHGGAWVRGDVGRTEHALMNQSLAALGMVVVAVDFRQSEHNHYPDSVADVNFALRWVRAHASEFNGSARCIGALGSSSGGHLVLLNSLRPDDPRYATLAQDGVAPDGARPDYLILLCPIPDPQARLAYAREVGNHNIVKFTESYFCTAGSIEDGNPQRILARCEQLKLPPALLLQGGPGAAGVVEDKNVSPEIQQRFAAAYRAAGGQMQLELLPGAPHNFVNTAGEHLDAALAMMEVFIRQRLHG